MSLEKQWARFAVVVGRSSCEGPRVNQSFGVLLVLSATLLAGGAPVAQAQLVFDFD